MDERILKWLFDIKIAIDEIEAYFLEIPKDFKHYSSNIILKRAVDQSIGITRRQVDPLQINIVTPCSTPYQLIQCILP